MRILFVFFIKLTSVKRFLPLRVEGPFFNSPCHNEESSCSTINLSLSPSDLPCLVGTTTLLRIVLTLRSVILALPGVSKGTANDSSSSPAHAMRWYFRDRYPLSWHIRLLPTYLLIPLSWLRDYCCHQKHKALCFSPLERTRPHFYIVVVLECYAVFDTAIAFIEIKYGIASSHCTNQCCE